MYHVRLNLKSADRYLPYQAFDTMQVVNDLAVRPEGWVQHVQRYTAIISTALLYGWRTLATDTSYVKDLLEVRILSFMALQDLLTMIVDGRYHRGRQLSTGGFLSLFTFLIIHCLTGCSLVKKPSRSLEPREPCLYPAVEPSQGEDRKWKTCPSSSTDSWSKIGVC